ncbi:MAG: hypothetical protein KC619_17640 [Myxococcales bacterium]|nr:hypothetical protein [Myxococcales bacterium]
MTARAPLLAALLAACGGPAPADAGPPGMDAGIDAAMDVDAGTDAGVDAGSDAGPIDAAVWVGPGCDPTVGIECDGDWTDRCDPACAPTDCCSPQNGAFTCMRRTAEGACPTADIWLDASRIDGSYDFTWRDFGAGACTLVEGCVGREGRRRLLTFATWTPNTGTADLYLGNPAEMTSLFTYSACHDHFHFDSYARYELRNAVTGEVVAPGHKQSFCLMDSYSYPDADIRGLVYSCEDQGIQRGFQDAYFDYLDCQWVDVTDVPPGDYVLRVELNYEHRLLESDYDNNVAEVPIVVRPDDVTLACPPRIRQGIQRNCGLRNEGHFACAPGTPLVVGCSSICGVGACTGDPFVRVCDGADDPGCDASLALAADDNSYCDMELCGLGGDCCPRAELVCPPSGDIVVFSGSYVPTATSTCDVVVQPR